MNESTKNQIRAYLRPGNGILILAILSFLMSFTGLAAFLEGEKLAGLIMLLIFLLPAVILVCTFASDRKRMNDFFQQAEASGAIEDLCNDFSNGVAVFKNQLRIGNSYVMGKRGVVAYKYAQITKIYQYEHRTNGITDSRQLKIVDSNGKTRTLCKLPTRGANQDDLVRLFAIIKTRNPQVHLGYK